MIPAREFPRLHAALSERVAFFGRQRSGLIMTFHHLTRALAGGLFATVVLNAAPGWASASDYRFEVAEVKPTAAGKSDVALRLIHTPDKKPVGRRRFMTAFAEAVYEANTEPLQLGV
jgi:hypothetical protein